MPKNTVLVVIPSDPPGRNICQYLRKTSQLASKLLVCGLSGKLAPGNLQALISTQMPDVTKMEIIDVDDTGGDTVADAIEALYAQGLYSNGQPLEVHCDPGLAQKYSNEVKTRQLSLDAGQIRIVPEKIPTDNWEAIIDAFTTEDTLGLKQLLDPHIFSDPADLKKYRDIVLGGQQNSLFSSGGSSQKIESVRRQFPKSLIREDSRGSMVRILGVHKRWADFFHQKLGKLAFPFAKWMATLGSASEPSYFRSDPEGSQIELPASFSDESRTRLTPALTQMPREEAALTSFLLRQGYGAGVPHPWQPIDDALRLFKAAPKLVTALSSPQKIDGTTLSGLVDDAKNERKRATDVSDLGTPRLSLAGGYEWREVSDEEFCSFGGPLGNCGESTGDPMFVLFDKRGKPHVAASHSDRGLDQIVGYGNSAPKPQYKNMVMALAAHLKTGLARGEKSWGASFGNESVVREFLIDIASNRDLAIQVLHDVLASAIDGTGLDIHDLEYLGTGRNGSAYRSPDGLIFKITTDPSEAASGMRLQGKTTETIHHIHQVHQLSERVWLLIQEGGLEKLPEEYREELDLAVEMLEAVGAGHALREGNWFEVLEILGHCSEPESIPDVLEVCERFGIPAMCEEVAMLGLSADFHSGNIMLREGVPVLTDLGTPGDAPGTVSETFVPWMRGPEWYNEIHDQIDVYIDEKRSGGDGKEILQDLYTLLSQAVKSGRAVSYYTKPQEISNDEPRRQMHSVADAALQDEADGIEHWWQMMTTAAATIKPEASKISNEVRSGGQALSEVNGGAQAAPSAGAGGQLKGAGSSAWSGGSGVLAAPKQNVPIDPEEDEPSIDWGFYGQGPTRA